MRYEDFVTAAVVAAGRWRELAVVRAIGFCLSVDSSGELKECDRFW